MDEPRFSLKGWGSLIFSFVLAGGFYFWQVARAGGFGRSLGYIVIDVALFGLGLLFWLAVFAQFVLPVRTLGDRQKIFDRLLLYISGGHGPSIFIENGVPRESREERKRRGPGVIWLDSASAAVTRTATSYKQVLGPGVHFTEAGEYLASGKDSLCSVDLHKQFQRLGPREEEDPFAEKKEEQSLDEYNQIQARRMEVSGLTRDGVEVAPNITVVFQIDADPVTGKNPGSHFAHLDPFKFKPPEDNPVFKAIVSVGINPKALTEEKRLVAWNELPARIAVDLWREYLGKFTLRQLFEAGQVAPPPPAKPPGEPPAETRARPATPHRGGGMAAWLLHGINDRLAGWADRCEAGGKAPIRARQEIPRRKDDPLPGKEEGKLTALQVINRMVAARMTSDSVIEMDSQGRLDYSKSPPSKEYGILKGRGLRIHAVSISNVRMKRSVEDELVRQWKASWSQNAKAEKAQVDRLRSFTELSSQLDGDTEYAVSIARSLKEKKPQDFIETIRTLLLRSRNELVKNDRFHRQAGMEREELEELIQWVERNGV